MDRSFLRKQRKRRALMVQAEMAKWRKAVSSYWRLSSPSDLLKKNDIFYFYVNI